MALGRDLSAQFGVAAQELGSESEAPAAQPRPFGPLEQESGLRGQLGQRLVQAGVAAVGEQRLDLRPQDAGVGGFDQRVVGLGDRQGFDDGGVHPGFQRPVVGHEAF